MAPEPTPAVQPSRALYIGNLSELTTEKELRKECEKFGEIESIFIKRNKNCAFVNFVNVKNATSALAALQNKRLGDTSIRVNYGKVPFLKNFGFFFEFFWWVCF